MAINFKAPKIEASASTVAMIDPVEIVALNDLRETEVLQPREQTFNEDHVRSDLLIKLLDGVELDPVEVVRETVASGEVVLWLWHGHNRKEAYRRAGKDIIRARVRNGSFRDARVLALSTNAEHGLKLSDGDKRRKLALAVELYKDELESGDCGVNELARRTRLSPAFVSGYLKAQRQTEAIKQPATRAVVRQGKSMQMKTAAITGRKPNATVAELREFLGNWVIDNYPNKVQETLLALLANGEKAEALYQQMEGIPTPHRQQDIVEAARQLISDRTSSEEEIDKSEAPKEEPVARPQPTTPKIAKTLVVAAAEPTLCVVFTHGQARRLLQLCLDSGDTELITAVQMELDKVIS